MNTPHVRFPGTVFMTREPEALPAAGWNQLAPPRATGVGVGAELVRIRSTVKLLAMLVGSRSQYHHRAGTVGPAPGQVLLRWIEDQPIDFGVRHHLWRRVVSERRCRVCLPGFRRASNRCRDARCHLRSLCHRARLLEMPIVTADGAGLHFPYRFHRHLRGLSGLLHQGCLHPAHRGDRSDDGAACRRRRGRGARR